MALQISLKKLSMAAVAAVAGTGGVGLSYRVAHAEQGKEPLEEKLSNPYPRTTAAGFDPEALERGAKVLREINQSKYAKQVIDITRKQEETRQAEEKTKQESFRAQQAQADIERQRVAFEEQRKLNQQQAQNKAQMLRYEDELARKRMQAEHEAQRQRNVELVKMQEESAQRQEAVKRLTEEQIQRERRQSERERAELERETLRVKALAEAEGRAYERRQNEDVYRRELLTKMDQEREKLLAAINTTFHQIGAGVYGLLSDREKLIRTVAVTTALAAGVYTTREGARVVGRYLERVLGQPSLVRESSRRNFPFFGRKGAQGSDSRLFASSAATDAMRKGEGFGDVILHPSLLSRVRSLASATANTKKHGAPFRNMVFYGPPGTGKTMAAKQLARESGLDYALMTGGDVGPLGPDAVTKIHQLFDWAGKSRKGLLLFIDEADAFLKERNAVSMSENLRSALNALLYRTGDQSRDIVLVVATNRPEDLDRAVVDRVDEALEFPLPGQQEREKLIRLYLDKYILKAGEDSGRSWRRFLSGGSDKIEVQGITDDLIQEAAAKTEDFSGRELAKLMVSMQGAAYGSQKSELTPELFREVLDYKVAEHVQRKKIAEQQESSKIKAWAPS